MITALVAILVLISIPLLVSVVVTLTLLWLERITLRDGGTWPPDLR